MVARDYVNFLLNITHHILFLTNPYDYHSPHTIIETLPTTY